MNTPTKKIADSLDVLAYLEESTKNSKEAALAYKLERVRLRLSESLKNLRISASFSQIELAEKMNVTQGWVSKLESPNNDHTLESIAEYLFHLGSDLTLLASAGVSELELASSKCHEYMNLKSAILPDFLTLEVGNSKQILPDQGDWSQLASNDEIPMGAMPNEVEIDKWWGKSNAA